MLAHHLAAVVSKVELAVGAAVDKVDIGRSSLAVAVVAAVDTAAVAVGATTTGKLLAVADLLFQPMLIIMAVWPNRVQIGEMDL